MFVIMMHAFVERDVDLESQLEDLADAYLYMAAFPARQRRRIAGLVFHARPIAEVLPGRDSNTAMITDESLPAVGSVTPRSSI